MSRFKCRPIARHTYRRVISLSAILSVVMSRSVCFPGKNRYCRCGFIDEKDLTLKAAFLDRDGVINREVNYLSCVEKFEYLPGSREAIKRLHDAGYSIVVVTNQAGIGKGLITELDYQDITQRFLQDMSSDGVRVLSVKHCPHHPEASLSRYKKDCDNRKPNPGMICDVLVEFHIDPKQSFLVGDKLSDILAAESAGLGQAYLVKSGHKIEMDKVRGRTLHRDLAHVADVVVGYKEH